MTNVAFPKCTSLVLWCMLFIGVDGGKMMHICHEFFVHALDDVSCCCLMSLARNTQTMSDAWKPLFRLPTIRRNCLADAFSQRPMSLNWCAHSTDDLCMPWIMLPAFGWCHLEDARKPGLMSPSRCIPTMTDAYMTCLLLPTSIRCCLADVHIHYPISPRQYTHTTIRYAHKITDACSHWLMLHVVGQRSLPNMHMACLFMNALDVAKFC